MNNESQNNSEGQNNQSLPSYVSYLSGEPAKSQEVTYLPAIDLDSFKSDDSSTGFIYQKKKSSITMKIVTACALMMSTIVLFIVCYCGIMVLLNMYHSNHHIIAPKSSKSTQNNEPLNSTPQEEPFCVCSITRTYRKSGLVQRATLHVPLHGQDLKQPSNSCSRICAQKRPEIMHQLDEQAKEARIAVRNELASDLSHQMNHLVHLPGFPPPLLSFPPTKLELVKGQFGIPSMMRSERKSIMNRQAMKVNVSPTIAPKRKVFIIKHQGLMNNPNSKPMTAPPEKLLNEMIHDGMNMINQVLMNDMQHDLAMMKNTAGHQKDHRPTILQK